MNNIWYIIVAVVFVQLVQSASINPSKEACICTADYSPVCASNGVTYSNECFFKCSNRGNDVKILFHGECETTMTRILQNDCTNKCNHTKRYLCASDGVTYENPCMFKCAQALNPSLKIAHWGPC